MEIKKFLKDHPLLTPSSIERELGMTKGTLRLNDKATPEKYKESILNLIRNYGYECVQSNYVPTPVTSEPVERVIEKVVVKEVIKEVVKEVSGTIRVGKDRISGYGDDVYILRKSNGDIVMARLIKEGTREQVVDAPIGSLWIPAKYV